MGYELSLENGVYQENKGTETLAHYAELFGLGENSRIEISESTPQIADEFLVTAAIGQSNHNYTTTQLARYTASLANKGTLYELTLIGGVQEGADGEIRQAAVAGKTGTAQQNRTRLNHALFI